jgi:Leucine-rich repeat (LRR) protein
MQTQPVSLRVAALLVAAPLMFATSGVQAEKPEKQRPECAHTTAQIDALPSGALQLRLVYPEDAVAGAAARFNDLSELTIIARPDGMAEPLKAETLAKLAGLKSLKSVTFVGYTLGPDHMAALAGFAALETLTFQNCLLPNKDSAGAVKPSLASLKACTKLHTLVFDRSAFAVNESTHDDIVSLLALRRLEIRDQDIGRPQVLAILRCATLETLAFRPSPSFGTLEPADFAALGTLQALKSLDLHLPEGTSELHKTIGEAIGKLKTLQSLRLIYQDLHAGLLESLHALPALRSLAVSGNMGGVSFGALKNLERLEIDGTALRNYRPIETYTGAQIAWLKDLKKLKVLSLRGGAALAEVPGYLTGVKSLRELTMVAQGSAGDLSGLSKLTSLESLNLTVDAATTEAGLAGVISANSKLKGLQVQAPSFGEPVARSIAGLKALTNLILVASTIGDAAPAASAFDGTAKLQRLELRGFSGLKAESLTKLTQTTQLRELALHDCEGVLNAPALNAIAPCKTLVSLTIVTSNSESFGAEESLAALTGLEQLHLACTLSDAVVKSIGSLKSLRYLDLAQCRGVSEAALKHLQGLDALQFFFFPGELYGSGGIDRLQDAVPFSWSN